MAIVAVRSDIRIELRQDLLVLGVELVQNIREGAVGLDHLGPDEWCAVVAYYVLPLFHFWNTLPLTDEGAVKVTTVPL